MSERHLVRAALACLVAGAIVMLAFDQWAARLAGVVLLVAFIALGATAIASPAYLGDEGERDARGSAGSPPSAGRGRRRRGG